MVILMGAILLFFVCTVVILFFAWHIIKRMVYSLVYVINKAIKDAKDDSSKNK